MDEQKTIVEELVQFHHNFSLSGGNSGSTSGEGAANKKRGTQRDFESEKQSLKEFHKSFNLVLKPNSTINGHTEKKVPMTLDITSQPSSRKKPAKKKKRIKFEDNLQFDQAYEATGEVLGTGARSTVHACRKKTTQLEYAVKIIPKTSDTVRDRVHKEVDILYICSTHRNFLKIEDFYESIDKFYLVVEKMAGPLLGLIQNRDHFTEREASLVTKEVADALAFLHSKGIAHRDLKPDNILCERPNQIVPIRICDFDLSSMITDQTLSTTPNLFTPVGSAEYMAPEVVDTFHGEVFSYDKKCDLWSLGVLVYMMLSGTVPFSGRCEQKCGWERGEECRRCQDMLLKRITKGEYNFAHKIWSGISENAKNLISRLLELDTQKRLSAQEVLRHPWVGNEPPATPLATPSNLKRKPSMPEEFSFYAASCLKCMSIQYENSPTGRRSFTLSPPGSSNLALRRENHKPPDHAH